jgi:LmbE family N-acetylglucosaminyl deacetylase
MLGAHIHMGNADQLVNTYLFDDAKTFHGAQWPSQHSFLLKWPLFMIIRLFGATPHAFMTFTVGIALLSVALLALILYRIERRLLLFGTLCLALASVLLLVPTQPYPGGVLPVNLAMITTRNVEYLVFIAAIASLAYAPRVRHWKFAAGSGLLVLLIASDKLFLTIGVGAAIMALLTYALARKWALVNLSARWLAAGLVGAVGATMLLWLINASGLTHIVGGSVAGPYGLVHSAKDLALGSVYAVLGLLTNLGANPASDTRLLGTIPAQTRDHLLSPQGIAFLMNSLLVIGMAFAAGKVLWSSIIKRATNLPHDTYFKISLMLLWTTIAACGVFVVSQHYYPVDARYLSIALFASFIILATFTRTVKWPPRTVVVVGVLFGVSILAGVVSASRTYTAENKAMAATNKRNELVAKVIGQHNVQSLVGDYWRVFPTKLEANNDLRVVPLSSCAQPSGVLTSTQWQPSLERHGFAYLLTLDRSLTGYTACNIDDVIGHYGRPNASTLISGSLKHPAELLLFYDRGAHNSAPHVNPATKAPATVLPIPLDELPYTACPSDTTILNIVAHQDDDLLFMNPSLQHDIQAGHCIRTVYMTSGDAGASKYYWVGREQGSEAAYSSMLGIDDIWIERLVRLPSGQFITVANPRGNSRVSLIFMHLPDGNLQGQGFASSNYESLARLEAGGIDLIHAVDHQSAYDAGALSTALTTLMRSYQPDQVRTQANLVSTVNQDHSDHMAVGRMTQGAYQNYLQQQYDGQPLIPLQFYVGYPIRGMAANVSGADLQNKERTFFAYAKYDNGVCGSERECSLSSNYGLYLKREYQNGY